MNDLTRQSRNPEVDDYLYASCAGEDYGQILRVGKDPNGVPIIDIELYNPQDLIWFKDSDFQNPLTEIELPPDTKVILRDLQWKPAGGYESWDEEKSWITLISCFTPGNGCYRCTKLFSLHKERTKF